MTRRGRGPWVATAEGRAGFLGQELQRCACLAAKPTRAAAFIEPMLLLPTDLPDRSEWLREPKFDGYHAVVFKSEARKHLRARNNNDLNSKHPATALALSVLPDDTVSRVRETSGPA